MALEPMPVGETEAARARGRRASEGDHPACTRLAAPTSMPQVASVEIGRLGRPRPDAGGLVDPGPMPDRPNFIGALRGIPDGLAENGLFRVGQRQGKAFLLACDSVDRQIDLGGFVKVGV
jgi:hypothetical protein